MTAIEPTLIAVAHGTKNVAGQAEIRRLVQVIQNARPGLHVELGWLELAEPLFVDVLAAAVGPVVVVPLLLSTGYHVKTDITAIVGTRAQTAVADQLGPDGRITAVVHERLRAAGEPGADVVLFASGSSDPEAGENLAVAAAQLAGLLGTPVLPRILADPDWRAGVPARAAVANYLLAPGYFNDMLANRAVTELASECVAAPIGAHPLVAEVALDRYDAAVATLVGGRVAHDRRMD